MMAKFECFVFWVACVFVCFWDSVGVTSVGHSSFNSLKLTKQVYKKTTGINWPQIHFESRCRDILQLKKSNNSFPYPHKFQLTACVGKVFQLYNNLTLAENDFGDYYYVAGRIARVNYANASETDSEITFTIKGDGMVIQALDNTSSVDNEDIIDVGDIVGVKCFIDDANGRERRIIVDEMTLLSPCLRIMFTDDTGPSTSKKRYINLYDNKKRQVFFTRAKILSYLRRYLDGVGFLEVETPILTSWSNAMFENRFVTHYKSFNEKLYLRSDPSFYLNMLLVGGIDRAYEIGKQFRNTNVSFPEYTSLDLVMAYTDYYDMIELIEDMLPRVVKEIFGGHKVRYNPKKMDLKVDIDFTPPFQKVYLIPELEKRLGVKFPPPDQFDTPKTNDFLTEICDEHKIKCPSPKTNVRLFNCLIERFIQSRCKNPTLVLDYPQFTSSYAKYHRNISGLVEVGKLFVMFQEIAEVTTILNDPFAQRERIEQQALYREFSDHTHEIVLDEEYLTAMEFGIPPSASLKLDVDKLVMILANRMHVKDVLLFQTEKKKKELLTKITVT